MRNSGFDIVTDFPAEHEPVHVRNVLEHGGTI